MLEFYIEKDFKLRQLRQCPSGEHMDGFAAWLHSAGYKRRPGQLILRGVAHLGHWALARGASTEQLDKQLLDSFARHLPACSCRHPFGGGSHYHAEGARRFFEHLQSTSVLPATGAELEAVPHLLECFCDWMRQHRGVTDSTLAQYKPLAKEFLAAVGEDAAAYTASSVRAFIVARTRRHGHSRAKSVVNAVRMFLRFLAAYGHCSPDFASAVPRIAEWKLSSLPRYISASDVELLVGACNATTHSGSRDRAVILLLARLGLRAGDVRDLRLSDLDWSQSRLRVIGKGRCETWLPLPQDVGDAILHYLEEFRPIVDDDHVFLRVHAPLGPLPSSGPVSKLVRRAIKRAGIEAPSMGAHVLRHSAATEMLRQGSPLDVIGSLLRHRCIESTAHYAKVDAVLLRSVAQPWPVNGGSSC